MIKALISFVSLFIIIYVGIDLFRQFTKKEKWEVVKTASYAAGVALVTLFVLLAIVVLF
jgi:hypothetical protein